MQSYGKVIVFCLVTITLFFIGYLLIIAQSLFIPIVLALLLTVLLGSIVDKLKAKKVPTYLIFPMIFVVLILGSFLFLDIIVVNINQIIDQAPQYQEKFIKIFNYLSNYLANYNINLKDFISNNVPSINIGKIISFVFMGIQNLASDIFLIILYIAFFFLARAQFVKKFKILSDTKKSLTTLKNTISTLEDYVFYKTLISIGTGVLTYVVLWLFGVDFPFLWALLTFILNFIPTLGSFIIVFIVEIFVIFQFMAFWPAFWVLLCLILVQTIFGNIIEPKLLGDKLNINAVFILIVVSVGGLVRGIIGMLIAVPILSIVNIICSKIESVRFIHIILRNE